MASKETPSVVGVDAPVKVMSMMYTLFREPAFISPEDQKKGASLLASGAGRASPAATIIAQQARSVKAPAEMGTRVAPACASARREGVGGEVEEGQQRGCHPAIIGQSPKILTISTLRRFNLFATAKDAGCLGQQLLDVCRQKEAKWKPRCF